MSTMPVHVSTKTHADLARLERDLDKPVAQILDEAVEEYQRKLRFEQLRESWERLRADPEKWAAYQREVASFYGEQEWPEYDR